MKFFFLILFVLLTLGCEKTQLFPVTAEVLLEKISSFKGKKAVLVNIWALWCEPCVKEFPTIIQLNNENEDLEVIFVSADFEEQFQEVKYFLKEQNAGSVSYIKRQKDELFINALNPNWSGSLPFTIIYGKDSGLIIDYWEGKKSFSKFSEAINRALALDFARGIR